MTRIISGVAGSLRLDVPPAGTRPTSDRVREAVFSTLDAWGFTVGTRVLDLYAGSGALGLEAASRGATHVTLVERHDKAVRVAQSNSSVVLRAFERTKADPPRIDVVHQSVHSFLEQAEETPVWDVVLIDPPYDLAEARLTEDLTALSTKLAPDAAVLVERSSRSPEPTWPAGLALVKQKRYGETVLWWAEPSAAESTGAQPT